MARFPARRGASILEYGIVAGLVSVISIGMTMTTGDEVSRLFCRHAATIAEWVAGAGLPDCARPSGEDEAQDEDAPAEGLDLAIDASAGETVSFSLAGAADLVVDWGDGVQDRPGHGDIIASHTYAADGRYRILIGGTATGFRSLAATQLREVVSFGTMGLQSLSEAFAGHDDLDALAPLPATVTDLSGSFRNTGAGSALAGIEAWDVSAVSDFSDSFHGSAANPDLAGWRPGAATDMSSMFEGAIAFDGDLQGWGSSLRRVADMSSMFEGATQFNGPLEGWNVSSVTAMAGMFAGAARFSRDLRDWCVPQIGTAPPGFSPGSAMQAEPIWGYCGQQGLRDGALHLVYDVAAGDSVSFRYDGRTGGAVLVLWDDEASSTHSTASATPEHIFLTGGRKDVYVAGRFTAFRSMSPDRLVSVESFGNGPLQSLAHAFEDHADLDHLAALPRSVTDLQSAFLRSGAGSALDGLGDWDVSLVRNFSSMFLQSAADQDLSAWEPASATTMAGMFAQATAFDGILSGWGPHLGNVTDMSAMFRGASAFGGDLSGWCVPQIAARPFLFADGSAMTVEPAWGFCGLPEATGDEMELTFRVAPGESARLYFSGRTGGNVLVTWGDGHSQATDALSASLSHSYGAAGTYTVRLHGTFSYFRCDSSDTLIAVESFGDVGLTSLAGAFANDTDLDRLAGLPVTVTNLNAVFLGTGAGSALGGIETWDVSRVTDFRAAFQDSAAENDISGWHPAGAIFLNDMFRGAAAFNAPIGAWGADLGNARYMQHMFDGAGAFDQPLAAWGPKLGAVADMSYMFRNATAFAGELTEWCVPQIAARPTYFSDGSAMAAEPAWGFCGLPEMTGDEMELTFRVPDGGMAGVSWAGRTGDNLLVSWGDGTVATSNAGASSLSHVYAEGGTYSVFLRGTFAQFHSDTSTTLVSVDSFGAVGLTSLAGAFADHADLDHLADLPDSITDLRYAFRGSGAGSALAGIETWNVSGVRNFDHIFDQSALRNDLSGWTPVAATGMSYMFSNAAAFAGDLSGWCIPNLPSEPDHFATGSAMAAAPAWGGCP